VNATTNNHMIKVTARAEIVKDVLDRFPDFPSKGLAEKIWRENPLHFNDAEDARSIIRYYRGSSGDRNRANIADRSQVGSGKTFIGRSRAPKRTVVRIPEKYNNILWLSDIHIPNHDQAAVNTAIAYGVTKKVNCIVIGGDLLDNEPFSNWEKKPSAGKVKEWFDMGYEFLLTLRLTFPDAKIYWMEGNHDQWYERWLIKHAPIVFDDHYYKLENRLRLSDLDITYLDQFTKVKAGKLFMLHGHTLIKGVFSPVNAARGLFIRAKSSTIIGHVHSSSKHSEMNLKGDLIGCWSVGCLCTLSPDYDPHNTKHNQGFAHIETGAGGSYHVNNIEIYNGQIL
jgi:predicted phosphodiesterase